MNRPQGPAEAGGAAPELLFCAVCQVSISAAEIERGEARRTPRGRTFCAACSSASPEERVRRRRALEDEFADDAPVPRPTPPAARTAPAGRLAIGAAPAPRPAAPAAAPAAAAPASGRPGTAPTPPVPAAPPATPPREVLVLDARVGELERAAFRLLSRLSAIEERLDSIQRRLG